MTDKKCAFCLNEIISEDDVFVYNDEYWHKECAKNQGIDTMQTSVKGSYSNFFYSTSSIKEIAINILYGIAWINLALGVIGAFTINLTNFGPMEVPYIFVSGTHTENNSSGIALGFLSLIRGIFGWALFYVVAFTAENIIAIKKYLKIS